MSIKWKSDFDRPALKENFIERNWVESEEEDTEFHLFWA